MQGEFSGTAPATAAVMVVVEVVSLMVAVVTMYLHKLFCLVLVYKVPLSILLSWMARGYTYIHTWYLTGRSLLPTPSSDRLKL